MSIIIVALPKIEDAKRIRKILMNHGFENVVSCCTASAALIEANQDQRGLIISGYKLTMPVKIYDLVNTVEMVLSQVERRYKKDRKKPRKRTEKEENYIRNAKFLLMERNHLSEEEAYRYIQKCSMDNGTNMVETAQMILTLIYDEC